MASDQVDGATPPEDESPPLLGSWRRMYLLVIGALAAVVVVFTALTRIYGGGPR